MALSNHERVGKALELLKDGLAPYVEREFKNTYGDKAHEQAIAIHGDDRLLGNRPMDDWDVAALLKVMWDAWNAVFGKTLGRSDRSLVSVLRDHRNNWAHQRTFSSDDAYRVLDSAGLLLSQVSAAEQQAEIEKMKMELLRVRFEEQLRSEKRRTAGTTIESAANTTLKPWREVVTPHNDVATGRYSQAEFAADLWQVHLGEGADEYRNPVEFFRRTYLTESLQKLLTDAVRRLASPQGGDPVVQLQTNFGGGKTHSMLALYHLFSGAPLGELLGIDAVLRNAETEKLPEVKRVVLVGNKISPGNPSTKPDGTIVRTLWGEIAWQLGGKKAYARIAADDERATNPGDVLRELMNEYGPCLILIDEWVAYARQLHDDADLPGGSFETHFSFAQALTESAKLAKQCLLVISLPASDAGSANERVGDDVEVGGERGRKALERLWNVLGRVESSWRPASAEEGFEIVRRRLFEPVITKEQFVARDAAAREFYDLYRAHPQVFPPETRDADYEKRLRAAYPIHPEIFDRLYNDWSTLLKFQRTRGVLRLMAAVIHSLWEKGDRNPLILPAHIPIDDRRVQFELTRYLPENWAPIIDSDVDGPSSLPASLDGQLPNLGRFSAFRRVARTIYLGSAPITTAAHQGLEDRRISIGCVIPGESPHIFSDALRRLSAAATYLYQDGSRYWYSTQPTVTKLAEDRAEQQKRDKDGILHELERRIRQDAANKGPFSRVHALPQTGLDVAEDTDARLVILGPQHPYSNGTGGEAISAATAIFESRGTSPRLYRNTLVFLAADKAKLPDLEDAVAKYLAWSSILSEADALGVSAHQRKQAETQKSAAESMIVARLPESWQWLMVPHQNKPQEAMEWKKIRLSGGQDALAVRAGKKLRTEELLYANMAGTILKLHLDQVPLWRGETKSHVGIRQLTEDFAKFVYLPRLASSTVLTNAISDGLGRITWATESFAYADSFDETSGRYSGLIGGSARGILEDDPGLLVHPNVASKQLAEDAQKVAEATPGYETTWNAPSSATVTSNAVTARPVLKRFHGSVTLDSGRVGRDAGRIAEEVVAHLVALMGAKVKVTLEIQAEIPSGAPDHVVRTVTENSRTLKFDSQGFEVE